MTTQRANYPFALLTGLALVGALAGCSSGAGGDAPAAADTSESDASTTESAGSYTDGSYSASADYTSPNGTEEVEVTVTLADGVISDVKVVGSGDNPTSKLYQGKFAKGIGDVVVGKSIDQISVDKVAGSSLTSAGFNDAIDEIKADAAS
ncbi:MAG: FMN-binding protein [Microbacteriaceae bacterium]|jgi:uncharacterized protein with FMN-binding domain|nr:FMN-binding protein [Microbacteriaceae bacterium]